MLRSASLLALTLLALSAPGAARPASLAEPATVCTITVNSPDEAEAMRRALPPNRYRFVELVERGRPDWLASACASGVRCDVLLVSGHFDGSSVFFSDRLDAAEYLPVAELERVSCSDACPGLFGQLREVYLFGCNTLEAGNGARPAADGAPLGASLVPESSRDRMRRIFREVPVIYGFGGPAPLGPAAAGVLARYLEGGGASEVGTGRASRRLLSHFSSHDMVAVRGLRDSDADARDRAAVCRFEDRRIPAADQIAFVHEVLRADPARTLRYLPQVESHLGDLIVAGRTSNPAAQALAEIAGDGDAKGHLLATLPRLATLALRARVIAVAARVGWFSEQEKRDALGDLFGQRLAADALDATDVDLACRLNAHGELEGQSERLAASAGESAGAASLLACLGDAKARQRAIAELSSGATRDAELAKVYLHHHPIASADEFRALADAIARMDRPESQAWALEALMHHAASDPDGLASLARLFASTRSGDVQRAVAGVLVRADIPRGRAPALVEMLKAHRIGSSAGHDVIDVLLRRLALG